MQYIVEYIYDNQKNSNEYTDFFAAVDRIELLKKMPCCTGWRMIASCPGGDLVVVSNNYRM